MKFLIKLWLYIKQAISYFLAKTLFGKNFYNLSFRQKAVWAIGTLLGLLFAFYLTYFFTMNGVIEHQLVSLVLDRNDTIAGVDKDKNGIRDDIDSYINIHSKLAKFNEAQLKATQQYARSMQSFLLVDIQSRSATNKVSDENTKALNCLFQWFDLPPNYVLDIESLTMNTKQRLIAYDKYNQSRNGTSGSVGFEEGDCVP